ncbi:MAG: hypothetical protein MHPSP_004207 [Paramarteilia canceri]
MPPSSNERPRLKGHGRIFGKRFSFMCIVASMTAYTFMRYTLPYEIYDRFDPVYFPTEEAIAKKRFYMMRDGAFFGQGPTIDGKIATYGDDEEE